MSSLGRMLAVLDLFTEEAPTWTPERISGALGYTQPTVYRYLQQLIKAGLISRGPAGVFLLGARIVELDYQMRLVDPLLVAGQQIMRRLAERAGCDVMLASSVGDRFITLHHVQGSEGFVASYGRGRRLPLFRGSLPKALLAAMPPALLRRLYERNAQQAAEAKLGKTWQEFLASIKRIHSDGYTVSMGELDSGLVGISVPVSAPSQDVFASLGFAMSKTKFSANNVSRWAALLKTAASEMVESMGRPPVRTNKKKVPVSRKRQRPERQS
jgi:DNA-binding IclR family transcriptional regulator